MVKKKIETLEKNKKAVSGDAKHEKLFGLFVSEVQELLEAEQQIVKALPGMIKAADDPDLKEAFTDHLEETREHVTRLQELFDIIDVKEKTIHCEAMQGLIQECTGVIGSMEKSVLRDAALISKAQCIEHYEISIYGTLRSFAKELKLSQAGDLLELTQNEEISADKKLSKLAEGSFQSAGINHKANEEF